MQERTPDDLQSLQHTIIEMERKLHAVRRIAASLSTSTKSDDVVRDALHISLDLAKAKAGSIILYYPDKKKLVFDYVVGDKADTLKGLEMEPDKGIAGNVFMTGTTSITEDVSKDVAHSKEMDDQTGFVTTNMVTVPLKSPDCEPLGVMQILNKESGNFDTNDVTLIEIMGSQIATAIKAARLYEQARLATIVRFIGDISHDVKNMITPAMTGAETLKMIIDDCYERFDNTLMADGVGLSDVKDSMDELRDIYSDMIEIIVDGCNAVQDRMAEISSAVKGVVSKPNYETSDIHIIASRVVHILEPHAQKKGITLNVDPSEAKTMADIDSKQIYNAIYNLLYNAIDACSSGDSVTLRLDTHPEGVFPDGNLVSMECIDTGPGIPEKVKALLFTDQAVSTKPMGTGLGTRIVKNVIDAHKGLIKVTSEEGKGTTIQCLVPVNRIDIT